MLLPLEYYAGHRQMDKAIEMMELFDREGGTLPKAFKLAIELCKATGAKHKELYFRAKLAYYQKEMKASLNFVRESVALNPNYEPAQKMFQAYERAIKKKSDKKAKEEGQ